MATARTRQLTARTVNMFFGGTDSQEVFFPTVVAPSIFDPFDEQAMSVIITSEETDDLIVEGVSIDPTTGDLVDFEETITLSGFTPIPVQAGAVIKRVSGMRFANQNPGESDRQNFGNVQALLAPSGSIRSWIDTQRGASEVGTWANGPRREMILGDGMLTNRWPGNGQAEIWLRPLDGTWEPVKELNVGPYGARTFSMDGLVVPPLHEIRVSGEVRAGSAQMIFSLAAGVRRL